MGRNAQTGRSRASREVPLSSVMDDLARRAAAPPFDVWLHASPQARTAS